MSLLLKEIHIKNFRSHTDSKIEFDTGINLIAGRNGAGKSSVLEAILVALYGPRPAGLKKNELARIGTSGYTINLTFEVNGDTITISRSSNGDARLIGKEMVEGDSSINQWVEKHICPSHIFTGAIYVRQGEIDSIIRDEEGRERIIRKITRIEDYENAWKNLGRIIGMLEREKENYLSFLSQEDELKRQKEEKKDELEKTRKRVSEIRLQIEELEQEVKSLNNRKEELEKLRGEIEKLNGNLATVLGELKALEERNRMLEGQKKDIENRIGELERYVEDLKELTPKAELYTKLEKLHSEAVKRIKEIEEGEKRVEERILKAKTELERIKKDYESLEMVKDRIKEIESRLEKLESSFKRWEDVKGKFERYRSLKIQLEERGYTAEKIVRMYEALQKARDEEDRLQEAFEKLAAKRSSLLTKAKQYQKAVEELKKAVGTCPVCGRELDEKHRKEILEEYRSEIKRIKEELEKLEEAERKLKEKREIVEKALSKQESVLKYKQILDELETLKKEIGDVNVEELKKSSDDYEKLREELGKLKGQEKVLQSSISNLEELKQRLEKAKEEREHLREQKEKIMESVNEEGFESLEELENQIEELRKEYVRWLELKDSERRINEEKDRIKRIISELKDVKEEMERKSQERSKIEGELERLRGLYSEEEHKKISEEFLSKSKELAGLKNGVEILEKNIATLERDLQYLENQISLLGEYRNKVEIIERKAIPELKRIREKFRKYKNIIAESAMKEVERYASEIFEELTEGKYSGVRLRKVTERGKERLKVFVVYQGEERDFGFLSGGEVIALGLSFRLALSMFMIKGRIPLLILDEPTPFLDEERRRKLVDITTNYLRKIPQVIVVSHDEELKDAADRVIFVDYQGGASRVRYVEAQ